MGMSPGRPEAGLLTRIRNAHYEGSEGHVEAWWPMVMSLISGGFS